MPHHHHSHHNPNPFGEIRSRKHHDILHPRMMIPLQGLTGAKELYAHQLKVDHHEDFARSTGIQAQHHPEKMNTVLSPQLQTSTIRTTDTHLIMKRNEEIIYVVGSLFFIGGFLYFFKK
jgi:hypothetical protein